MCIQSNSAGIDVGFLTGMYQLFIVTGSLIAFWTNFGAELHLHGATKYIVPLAVQGLPALFLFFTDVGVRRIAKVPRSQGPMGRGQEYLEETSTTAR
ncbi:hypothetical protein RRF57_010079 [Xylaria bambusicola]|uniref:Uncharacterized protein n=1 Tax=Xylaria bambusicola TaxID=326684 RepID=A0AAN7UKN7_9PEZI